MLRTSTEGEERLRFHIEYVNRQSGSFLSIYGICFAPEIWQIYIVVCGLL